MRRAVWAAGLAVALACAGPAEVTDGAPLAGPSETPARAACHAMDRCGVQPFDQCLAETSQYPDDALWSCVAQSSCEQIAAGAPACTGAGGGGGGGGGRDGSGCRSNGVQDCPLMETCCAPQGGDQHVGAPGSCVSIPVCNFPRR
jgi:hypothetical protein